ncbi:MAG: transporter substrate-binding domain-containing protein [Candidatus Eremiobacteraeota bacterium]|nr:transporter substrate-binding domain-containing protein [Candidatus Eremiobacteraeota bacterium]
MKKSILFLAIAVLLLGAAPPKIAVPVPDEIKSAGVLKIGVKCDYPPFGFVDTSGATVGFDLDFAHQLAQLAFGNPNGVQIQCVTSADRIPYLTTHRVDLIVATLGYNEDRARVIAFSKPYFSQTGRVLVTKQSRIRDPKDLAAKTVLLLKGTPYVKWFQQCLPTANQIELDTSSEALTALKEGRGDGFANDDTLLVGLAEKDPTLTVVGSLYSSKFGVGVRLGDDATLRWVNAAVTQLQAQDYFYSEFKKWVTDKKLQSLFSDSMPRPGHDIVYPTTAVVHC